MNGNLIEANLPADEARCIFSVRHSADISGRVLLRPITEHALAKIDVSTLSTGAYFVRYSNSSINKTIAVTKL